VTTEWLSLKDAAKATGKSTSAIRSRRERGGLLAKTDPDRFGQYLYAVQGSCVLDAEGKPIGSAPASVEAFQPAYKPSGEVPRVAAICSDVHIPEHDLRAWEGFLAWVSDWQPDEVVLAGDILELESCSRHGGTGSPAHFTEEIAAGRAELERLRALVPKAAITYLEGNHETRLSRLTVSETPTLEGALDIPSQLDLAGLGIAWRKEGEKHSLGKLDVVHGWYANKYHAAKHVEVMGGSVLYGHTHRPQTYMMATAEGVRGGFGNGCLRSLDPAWFNGRPSGWVHGFSVVHVWADGSFQVTPIWLTRSRRFAYGGKVYG